MTSAGVTGSPSRKEPPSTGRSKRKPFLDTPWGAVGGSKEHDRRLSDGGAPERARVWIRDAEVLNAGILRSEAIRGLSATSGITGAIIDRVSWVESLIDRARGCASTPEHNASTSRSATSWTSGDVPCCWRRQGSEVSVTRAIHGLVEADRQILERQSPTSSKLSSHAPHHGQAQGSTRRRGLMRSKMGAESMSQPGDLFRRRAQGAIAAELDRALICARSKSSDGSYCPRSCRPRLFSLSIYEGAAATLGVSTAASASRISVRQRKRRSKDIGAKLPANADRHRSRWLRRGSRISTKARDTGVCTAELPSRDYRRGAARRSGPPLC